MTKDAGRLGQEADRAGGLRPEPAEQSRPEALIPDAGPWGQPRPSPATVASFAELAAWFEAVRDGRWNWSANSRCKYVEIRLDTRAGAYLLQDRDGHKLTPEQLLYQYSSRAPEGGDA